MISIALFSLCVLAVKPSAPSVVISDRALLAAISQAETGGNAAAIGPQGELGLYQFTRATWNLHTTEPFADALDATRATAVAQRHLAWLRELLAAHDVPATPYNLAAAWNAGVNAVIDARIPTSTRDYAERVEMLWVKESIQ